MKHTKVKKINFGNEQKICTVCSIPLEIKEVGSSKGNCYRTNYNNRIYQCNTCTNKKKRIRLANRRKTKRTRC